MQKDKVPTLVFNCDYNGLALIQSLGRKGFPVYALDSKRGIGTRSRYAKYRKVPDPLIDEEGFIAALLNLGKTLSGKPLLLPTNDHWAEAVSKHKKRLAEIFSVSCADYETVSLLLDKEKFGFWCMEHDIQAPKVCKVVEFEQEPEKLGFPMAIKANARRKSDQNADGAAWARAADALRFRPCRSIDEVRHVVSEARRNNVPIFAQQLVNGRSDCMRTIGVYANLGTVFGIVYGRKVRGFPAEYGDCIVGQAEPVPEWAEALVKKVCGLLSYTGIAEFEVMVDAVSGERYLIEINPRSWSWVGVAPAAGVDLAWLAYSNLVLGNNLEVCKKSCEDGKPVFFSKILADFQNTILWYRFDTPEWAKSPWRWWLEYREKQRVFAEFSRDDLNIAFFSILLSVKQFLVKLKSSCCPGRTN